MENETFVTRTTYQTRDFATLENDEEFGESEKLKGLVLVIIRLVTQETRVIEFVSFFGEFIGNIID